MPEMEVTLGRYVIEVATEFGPRITNFRRQGGPPMFASLGPDQGLEHQGRFYRFHGGHRLWAAPEIPAITYAPDDHECAVGKEGDTLRISAPPDLAGLIKEIEVTAEGDSLVVEHRLSAISGAAITASPWAITQAPPGGSAILSLTGVDTAPLPNRQIVFWPYTNVDDARIRIGDQAVVVTAGTGSELKVGTGPTPGSLGYLRDGWLFVKTLEWVGEGEVPDFGAVHQVFVGRGFCELESVGGVETLSTDIDARLTERWQSMECPDEETATRIVVDGLR